MRCIFCKRPSDGSRSVEHIIPQSLGNTLYTLPPGVVCDKCNNYFSREVEGPFLSSGAIRSLRAYFGVPTKKGKLVGVDGILLGEHAVTAYIPHLGMRHLVLHTADGLAALLASAGGEIVFPWPRDAPEERVISRFLAKAAVEAIADRGLRAGLDLGYLVDERQLDEIRDHARIGDPRVPWPTSVRRIYDAERPWSEADGSVVQRVHEFDILRTEWNEYFFVLAIFGLELAINLGGPEIAGYERWLEIHDGTSPLYWGANASSTTSPQSG